MESAQAQLRHQIQTPVFTFNPNNKFRRDQTSAPRQYSPATMDPNDMSKPVGSLGMGMWSPAAPQVVTRPRPNTIHLSGFSYCLPEEYSSLPAWDSSTMPSQPINFSLPTAYSVQDDYSQSGNEHGRYSVHGGLSYGDSTVAADQWAAKPFKFDETTDMPPLDTEMTMGQAFTTDEAVPVLDLRFNPQGVESEPLSLDTPFLRDSRRFSGSSFTLSTTGALSEMPSYEDFSTTLSEAPSFTSEYPPPSNRNSLMSSTQLSPVASPRMTPQNRSDLVRTQSRGRASPSPRPTMRSNPYSMEGRNKRWSTGSYAPIPNRRPSPFVYQSTPEALNIHQRMSSRHSSPTLPNAHLPLNIANLQTQQHPFLMSNNTAFHHNSMLLPSHIYHENTHTTRFDPNPPLLPSHGLSHGLFRMLQSNADPHALHSHYSDLSDPPDLFASLNEDQVQPPPADMNPSDPDLVPHEQELRFDGDLYTPRWVRGHGNKREGWCGICKPGRWLVLKNSAFWYDKSFTHGISAATGSPFQEPQETRRMDGNPDVWEGLCGSCSEWVALVSTKKKGTTWFRHAYKCHTHPKIKDAPKRRRESSHTRAFAASNMAMTKAVTGSSSTTPTALSTAMSGNGRTDAPMTPLMTPSQSLNTTPTSVPPVPRLNLVPAPLNIQKGVLNFDGMGGMI